LKGGLFYFIMALRNLKMAQKSTMKLKAIGTVKNRVKQKPDRGFNWHDVVSEIIIDSSLTQALDGLDEFSHIIVICWLHEAADKDKMALKVYPRGRHDLPPMGLFASRSPYRPNPLGKATVRLLKCRGNILRVAGLDAINGTPVVDIKPYIPGYDSAAEAKAPEWARSHSVKP